jgi:(p)ppGpp synthase/HD superfamily hydrolase
MATLEQANVLAAQAHEGQVDKPGASCIRHPLRMMLVVEMPKSRMVGEISHGAIEAGNRRKTATKTQVKGARR